MAEEKSYVFHVYQGPDKHKRFELTENQLEPHHKKMLLAQLFQVWENTPQEQRSEFIREISERSMKAVYEHLEKAGVKWEERNNRRDKRDELIDLAVKEWRKDKHTLSDEFAAVVRLIRSEYSEVEITYILGKQLSIKIGENEAKYY